MLVMVFHRASQKGFAKVLEPNHIQALIFYGNSKADQIEKVEQRQKKLMKYNPSLSNEYKRHKEKSI